MDKSQVRNLILQKLEAEFSSRQRISSETRSGGNDSESRAESKYDTLAIEQNYLADGLAKQAFAAGQAMEEIEKMSLPTFTATSAIDRGALIELEFARDREWFFLAPAGGGLEVTCDGITVTVITPDAPLGLGLMGAREGDVLSTPKARVLRVC